MGIYWAARNEITRPDRENTTTIDTERILLKTNSWEGAPRQDRTHCQQFTYCQDIDFIKN